MSDKIKGQLDLERERERERERVQQQYLCSNMEWK